MFIQVINPTKLGEYLVCPQKYKFLDRKDVGSSSPQMAFGIVVHKVLQILHESKTCESVDMAANSENFGSRGFLRGRRMNRT